ncbi:MAG: TadE/TadG family type IV pilus assembly protein [Acidimicrobiia bacterium]
MGGRPVLRQDRGSVTVELFLVLPIMILVVVAAIQLVSVARAHLELQSAVRDGARVAATTPDPAKAVEAVLASLPPAMRDRARVSVERPSRAGAAAVVSVSIHYLLGRPFPADLGVNLSARTTMRTER